MALSRELYAPSDDMSPGTIGFGYCESLVTHFANKETITEKHLARPLWVRNKLLIKTNWIAVVGFRAWRSLRAVAPRSKAIWFFYFACYVRAHSVPTRFACSEERGCKKMGAGDTPSLLLQISCFRHLHAHACLLLKLSCSPVGKRRRFSPLPRLAQQSVSLIRSNTQGNVPMEDLA